MLLRAFLSAKRKPSRELITSNTICQSLTAADMLKYSKRLMAIHQAIDASALFLALRIELESQLPSQDIRRLLRGTVRSLEKWFDAIFLDDANSLTESSELSLMDLISFLAFSSTFGRARGKRAFQTEKTVTSLLRLSFKLAAQSTKIATLLRLRDQIDAANRRLSTSVVESFIESETVSHLADLIRHQILESMRSAILTGKRDELDPLFALSRQLNYEDTLKLEVLTTWNDKRGALDSEIQKYLTRYLDFRLEQRPVALTGQSESVQISQMATVLLQLWESRGDSPRVAEAFRMFAVLAERFFGLRLCGPVGSQVDFDPKLYEFAGARVSGRVVVLRPWVEWSEHAVSKIIIKAVVDPA
jgi:hypothetical protein